MALLWFNNVIKFFQLILGPSEWFWFGMNRLPLILFDVSLTVSILRIKLSKSGVVIIQTTSTICAMPTMAVQLITWSGQVWSWSWWRRWEPTTVMMVMMMSWMNRLVINTAYSIATWRWRWRCITWPANRMKFELTGSAAMPDTLPR